MIEGSEQSASLHRLLEFARPKLPNSTAHAENALGQALSHVRASAWPEVAWSFSRINGDGFPVEFTFSSSEGGLRYTSEIAGPEVDEQERWRYALNWAGDSDSESMRSDFVTRWQSGPLRWGAWVGGYHSESACRRKAYLEVSTTTATESPPGVPSIPGAKLRFLGIDASGTQTEFYFRRDALEQADVGRLLWLLGSGACFAPICETLSATLPWPTHDRLLPTSSGFSIAAGGVLTIYTYARCVWGGDANIRRCLLDLAEKHCWDFELYEAVTRPLESRTSHLTFHGILAWVAVPGRPVELRISVRPP